jgi:SAM-dependent methyltransferase
MPFVDLFSEKADLYASARPRYPEELFVFIASLAPAHLRAWDCGTGSGQAAVSLALHFDKVFGSDPSPEQLSHATKVGNVSYSEQRAEQTTFPDQYFDAICAAQALHWFDLRPFFSEVKRVAVPNAAFVAWGYNWFSVSPDFDAVFKFRVLDVIAPYWAPQNRLLWNGYADISLPFARLATPKFHIRARWDFHELFSYVHTWSATRRCISKVGSGLLESAQRELLPLWGPPEAKRDIAMPLEVLAGVVS